MSQRYRVPPYKTLYNLRLALYPTLATSLILGTACKAPPTLDRLPRPMPTQPVANRAPIKTETINPAPNDIAENPESLPPVNPMASIPAAPSSQAELAEIVATEPTPAYNGIPTTTTAAFAPQANSTESVASATPIMKPAAKLVIDGIRPELGTVKVAIYTTAIAFPNPTSASQTFVIPATKSTIETTLPELGRFAVGVYQDINSDGELNRNRFGIPTEPFAFSNNAIGKRGPPTFDQAAVVQPSDHAADNDGPLVVSIKLP